MIINELIEATWKNQQNKGYLNAIQSTTGAVVLKELLGLAVHEKATPIVSGIAIQKINELEKWLQGAGGQLETGTTEYALMKIAQFRRDPQAFKLPSGPGLPDGSPIGSHMHCSH